MNIINIAVTDCNVIQTTVSESLVSILFEQIYDVQKKEFIQNIELKIFNWKEFEIKTYILEKPFSKPIEKKIMTSKYESFELIQEIIVNEEILELKGFSKDTGHWLEYFFKDYEYKLYQK